MDASDNSEQAKRLADIFSQAAAAIQQIFGQTNSTVSSYNASSPTMIAGQPNPTTPHNSTANVTIISSDDDFESTTKRSRHDPEKTLGSLDERLHKFRRVMRDKREASRKKVTFSERLVCVVPSETTKTPTAAILNRLKAQGLGDSSEKIGIASDMSRAEFIATLELQFRNVDFTNCRFARGLRARKLDFAQDFQSLLDDIGYGTKLYVVLASEQRTTQGGRNRTAPCTTTSGALLQLDEEDVNCHTSTGPVLGSELSLSSTSGTTMPSTSWATVFPEDYEQPMSDNEIAVTSNECDPFVQKLTAYLDSLSTEQFVIELGETLTDLKNSFFHNPIPKSQICPVLLQNCSKTMTRFFSRLSCTETMIKVDFISQAVMDFGGPRRQALTSYLKEIVNRHFIGDDRRKIIVQEPARVADGSYIAFGKAIGHALLLEKIRLNCLAMAQVCFLVGGMDAARSLPFAKLCEAINDPAIRNSLTKVYQGVASSSEEAAVRDEMAKRDMFGQPTKERCKELALEYTITSRLGALLGLKQGLDFYDLTKTMETRVEVAASLMAIDVPLTAEVFYEMLQPHFSTVGSNRKTLEEQTMSAFYLVLSNAAIGIAPFSLEDLLLFTSGYDNMPAGSFKITLEFSDPERLPEARTCGPALILPLLTEEDDLQDKIASAVLNFGGGFGNV